MEKKSVVVVMAVVIVALVSVFLLVGRANSLQKKIDYLSDKYAIFECKTPWKEYPASFYDEMQRVNMVEGTWEFEVKEAASWTAFKSLLQTVDHGYSIFYDLNARVIWFDSFEYDYDFFGRRSYLRITVWFIRG